MSGSPSISTSIFRICGPARRRSIRPASCRTMAIPTSSPPAATPKQLIAATGDYIRALQRAAREPAMRELTLEEFVARRSKRAGSATSLLYEDVHRNNVGGRALVWRKRAQ